MVVDAPALLQWFKANGGSLHPNVSVIKGDKKHLHFVVDKPIRDGEKLLDIPETLILSLDSSDFAEIDFTGMHDQLLSEMTPFRIQTLVALYEMLKPNCQVQYEPMPIVRKKKKKKRQRTAVVQPSGPVQGKESIWALYLQYLSERSPLNTPVYWTPEARNELKGTSLEERIDGLEEAMKEEMEELVAPFFNEAALTLTDKSLLTFPLFKKFYSFAHTYCWSDESAEIFLAPMAELFSYTNREEAANVEMKIGDENVSIWSKGKLEKGTKLFNYVGDMGTAEYLWKWGHIDHTPTEECPKGSAFDSFQLEPELLVEACLAQNEDDPCSEDKIALLQEIGMLMDFFEIEKKGEIPNDLLLAVKVFFMDEEEFSLYKNEMMLAGFLMPDGEDEDGEGSELVDVADDLVEGEEDDEDDEEVGDDGIEPSDVSKDGDDVVEESVEEEEEEDVQILPEIGNEEAVFTTLISVMESKMNSKGSGSSEIKWDKAGYLRKPSLVSAYLKDLEKEILTNFITQCQKQLAKVKAGKDKSDKKRKLPEEDSELPPAKKAKK